MSNIIETILGDKDFEKLYLECRSHIKILNKADTYNVIGKIRQELLENLHSEKTEEVAEKYQQYIDALFAHAIIDSSSYIQKIDTGKHRNKPFTSKREKVNYLIGVIGLPYIKYFVANKTNTCSNYLDALCVTILECKTIEEKEAYLKNFHEKLVYLSSFFASGNDIFHKLLREKHVTIAHLEAVGPEIASFAANRIDAIFFGCYSGSNNIVNWYMYGYPQSSLEHMKALGPERLTTLDPKIILRIYLCLSPDLIPLVVPTHFDGFHFTQIGVLSLIPKDDLKSLIDTFLSQTDNETESQTENKTESQTENKTESQAENQTESQTENKKTFFDLTNEYVRSRYKGTLTERELDHIIDKYDWRNPTEVNDTECLELLHIICKINSCVYTDILKSPIERRILKLLGYSRLKQLFKKKGRDRTLYRRRGIFYYAALKVVDELTQAQIEELGGTQVMRSNKLAEKVLTTYHGKIDITNEVVKYGKELNYDELKNFTLGQLHALKSSNCAKLSKDQLSVVSNLSPNEIQQLGNTIRKYTSKEIENQICFDLGKRSNNKKNSSIVDKMGD